MPALPLAVRGRDVVELLRPLYRALDDAYAPGTTPAGPSGPMFYRASKKVGGSVAGPDPTGRDTGSAGTRASTSS